MIQAKCIQKFRNKQNKIYGYRLMDVNGQTQDVTSDNLKAAIRNKKIHVVNLNLTSDNRLIDTTEKILPNKKVLGQAPKKHINISIDTILELDDRLEIFDEIDDDSDLVYVVYPSYGYDPDDLINIVIYSDLSGVYFEVCQSDNYSIDITTDANIDSIKKALEILHKGIKEEKSCRVNIINGSIQTHRK